MFEGPPFARADGTCASPVTSLHGVDLERLCIDGTQYRPRGINFAATLALTTFATPVWRPCGIECAELPSRRPSTRIAAATSLLRRTPGGATDLVVYWGVIAPALDGGAESLLEAPPGLRVTVRHQNRMRSIRLHRTEAGPLSARLPSGATSCRLSGTLTDATFSRYYELPPAFLVRFPCHPPRGKFLTFRSFGFPGPVLRYTI